MIGFVVKFKKVDNWVSKRSL